MTKKIPYNSEDVIIRDMDGLFTFTQLEGIMHCFKKTLTKD